MARYRGTFSVAASYEPLTATPFDARQLVEYKSDLTDPKTWRQENGDTWTYVGMMVTVANDLNDNNNGTYVLTSYDYTQESNWRKCADERDIARVMEEIANIEFSGEGSISIEVDELIDLPKVGDPNATYYVKEDLSIQRWNEATQSYISFGGTNSVPDLDSIKVIYGGNAHGTD
jgi:hypothetical protein